MVEERGANYPSLIAKSGQQVRGFFSNMILLSL